MFGWWCVINMVGRSIRRWLLLSRGVGGDLYAATDRHSGYGSSVWPALREAIEDSDAAALAAAEARYLSVAAELRRGLDALRRP
ncbi:MAG: hypothetical protein ACKO0W_11535 [Planctomycetota bacterium]